MLPFFKDERYIKVNEKPLLIIFLNFLEKENMCIIFNDCAKNNGLKGIFFAQSIQYINQFNIIGSLTNINAVIIREPDASFYLRKNIYLIYLNKLLRYFKIIFNKSLDIVKYNAKYMIKKSISTTMLFCKKMNQLIMLIE